MAALIWSTLMQTTSGGAFCRPQFQAKNKSKEITSSKGLFFSADVERILAVVAVCWRKTPLIPCFFFCLVCLFMGLFMMIKTTESRGNFRWFDLRESWNFIITSNWTCFSMCSSSQRLRGNLSDGFEGIFKWSFFCRSSKHRLIEQLQDLTTWWPKIKPGGLMLG